MSASSGRTPFSQDMFEDVDGGGESDQDPPMTDSHNNKCGHCNNKMDEILRKLDIISQAVLQLEAKMTADTCTFKVKGSAVEFSLMEKAGRCFVEDPFFGQKAEKLVWLKPLLSKNNVNQRHTEECRRYIQRKTSDWRNNLRIKILSADRKVEAMTFEEFRNYMVSGMRFMPSSEATTHMLLVLRWFVYENRLFGLVKGRKTSDDNKIKDFWGELVSFRESKQAFLREENGWRDLRQRDGVRSDRARRSGEVRISATM